MDKQWAKHACVLAVPNSFLDDIDSLWLAIDKARRRATAPERELKDTHWRLITADEATWIIGAFTGKITAKTHQFIYTYNGIDVIAQATGRRNGK